jgi:transglutaminase-like putative cysteine protease
LETISQDERSLLLSGWTSYGVKGGKNLTVNAYVAKWRLYALSTEAAANRNAFVVRLQGLSDMEKVERINQYISDRITYEVALAGNNWDDFFTTGIVGDCENYTDAATHLFHTAGIPCIYVRGHIVDIPDAHLANMIHINGQWEYYDAANSESLGRLVFGKAGEQELQFKPASPYLNQFAMEAVLPGSTK